jgi:hypothetical protein
LIAVAEAEFRYSDLLPTGADDTPLERDLIAQGAQDPAVRLRVRLLVASFGGIEDAEDALPEPRAPAMLESSGTWLESTRWVHPLEESPSRAGKTSGNTRHCAGSTKSAVNHRSAASSSFTKNASRTKEART